MGSDPWMNATRKEKTMKSSSGIIGVLVLSAASAGLLASGSVMGASMLCALTNTVSCDATGECITGPANAVNLPVFMRFLPDKKVVESAKGGGERRSSEIAGVKTRDDLMVFHGEDGETGWRVTINKSTGDLAGTIAADGMGYLIFGSCIAGD